VNTLEYYGQRVGAFCRPFKQGTWIKQYHLTNRSGVCDACSIVYLAFMRQNISFGTEMTKAATMAYVDKLQTVLERPDNLPGSNPVVPRRVEMGYAVVSFTVDEAKGAWKSPYKELAEFITGKAGYYHVCLPNHACAAVKLLDGRVKFFDPNYGDAMFADKTKFGHFIYAFLHDRNVMRNYELAEGGTVSAVSVQVKKRGA